MLIMKNVGISVLFVLLTTLIFAQPVLEFGNDTHDFGAVIEGEKVTHVFVFKNVGDAPLQLESVKPSCGCTSPDWSKDEVAPGASGEIKVQYNSKMRLGTFNKGVSVVSNEEITKKKLTIRGVVLYGADSTVTKDSLAQSAIIDLGKKEFFLGEVEKLTKEKLVLPVENKGKTPLVINKVKSGCGCAYITDKEFTLAPGEKRDLTLTFNSAHVGDLSAKVIIESNDLANPFVEVVINASVKESLRGGNMLQTTPGGGF